MTHSRTQSDVLRRLLVIRVAVGIVWILIFVGSLVFELGLITLFYGLLALIWAGLAVFYVRACRRTDPAQLEKPLDPSLRSSFRYLRPKKYPYQPPNEPS